MPLTANQAKIVKELRGLTSDLLDRRRLGSALGKQYQGDRDLYETLGYKLIPTASDYEAYFARNEIAKAAIKVPVDQSWETFPAIEESDERDTPFEKAALDIITKFKLPEIFSRLDTLSGLGRWSVLMLGFSDGVEPSIPVTSASQLLYATPYAESAATVQETEKDAKSPRFGLPTKYQITTGISGVVGTKATVIVDYTRVIHVAQECLTNSIEGTPQLEVIFNRLFDIEKLVGGDAEAYWRLVDQGMILSVLDGVSAPTDETKDKFEDKILDFIHRLKRHLVLTGMKAEKIEQTISDPINHFSMLIDMVAAGKGIPKRLLLGSEVGQLASTTDLTRWLRRIKSRRERFCEPAIIRPFFDRLIEVGVLKRDQKVPYGVKWDDLLAPSDKEKADVGGVLATALASYLNSGADAQITLEDFLIWLGRSKEEITRILENAKTQITEGDDAEDAPIDAPPPIAPARAQEPVTT